ncbi:Tetratricopeptide TPR_1 repeat-containing protein [Crinalium epipsammum PCC 9333]|uniref:Tetratricopeptide TPR_1 repeat-containing protein n=1 Tax=Crinalium epipsammum PCC 9333 TaxID=1173022 RepID=K9VVT8_9CYAN|nr:tetratricopeptide repeat protein [Crinalium epipsammum]AFZ12066.1 Tetratricopeptide TPR_1 repeat-containing protein [Crinalium epipsammum PCC 9333]
MEAWYRQDHTSRLKFLKAAIATALLLLCGNSRVLADNPQPPPNPLEITTPDPLLPKNQPLNEQELLQFKASLDELNNQATTKLRSGNKLAAYDLWHRELRLRQQLGALEELAALGRVGGIAWGDNQKAEVKLITQRLQAIQQQAQTQVPLNLDLLQSLGQAYQQVRVIAPAIDVYQIILTASQQQQNQPKVVEALSSLAELYLNWFDYPKAAENYEKLLKLSQNQVDVRNQLIHLQQLANVYDKVKQPENSIRIKQQLIAIYLQQQTVDKLPAVKMAIASDYEAINQPDEASQNYQEAYQLAISQQQFADASTALDKLGALYYSHNHPDAALQIYQTLLEVEQQSNDFYGLMNTYDHIGQIYFAQRNFEQAKAAFQQGLDLANSLKYQQDYFASQIERVNQQKSP